MTATMTAPTRTQEPLARLRAQALIAAPLLLAVGSALHPSETSDARVMLRRVAQAEDRWWVSHVLLMLGAGLLVAGAHVLLQYLDRWSPRLARLGTAFVGIGAAAVLALIATESTAAWALSRSTDLPAAATAMDDVVGAVDLMFLPFVVAFHVGLVLLAVALRRTPGTLPSQPIALVAGSLLLFVGNAALSTWMCAVAGVLLAVALVPVGVQALQRRAV